MTSKFTSLVTIFFYFSPFKQQYLTIFMSLDQLLKLTEHSPELITFDLVMNTIDKYYIVRDVAFSCGEQHNLAGENKGSCKIFSFALLHKLSKQQTLNLFAEYYRNDVLKKPDGNDHQNAKPIYITC